MEELIIIGILAVIVYGAYYLLKKQSDKFRESEFKRLREEEESSLD